MARQKKDQPLPKGISLRKDGVYQGRLQISGKRYSFYDKDLKSLKKVMQKKQLEAANGLFVQETKIKVNDWFESWLKEYKAASVKYGTLSGYRRVYKSYIADEIGKRRLPEVRPEHIQKIYNDLSKAGYSHKTISLSAIVLNGMFKQAFKNQMIVRNPVELASIPRNTKKKKEISVMTKEEQKIFLQYAKESAYCRIYTVALGTGLRVGEIRALEWSDIDYKNNVIHVTGTLKYSKDRGYFKDLPKTNTSFRDVPMIPEVVTAFKEQRAEQIRQRLQLGDLWRPESGMENFVFTGYYTYHGFGKNLCHGAINHDMAKIEERIKEEYPDFPHITPHTLRHTFATRGLENGIPPKVMQEILGHTSITMTLDIYSHVLPDTKAAEIMKVSGMF